MKYEIIGKFINIDHEFVAKRCETFDEVVIAILELMHENPDCRYSWRFYGDKDEIQDR